MSNEPRAINAAVQAMVTSSLPLDALFDALSNPRRRTLLTILQDHQRPISERALAARIAAQETDTQSGEVTEEDQQHILADLRHAQLSRLVNTGIIVRDRDRKTVSIADHPALERGISALLRSQESNQPEDRVFRCLTDRRRRLVVSVLDQVSQPVTLTDLAEQVAARADDTSKADSTGAAVDRIRTRLYHVHLPKLADAGIIDYDTERQLVKGRKLPLWYQE